MLPIITNITIVRQSDFDMLPKLSQGLCVSKISSIQNQKEMNKPNQSVMHAHLLQMRPCSSCQLYLVAVPRLWLYWNPCWVTMTSFPRKIINYSRTVLSRFPRCLVSAVPGSDGCRRDCLPRWICKWIVPVFNNMPMNGSLHSISEHPLSQVITIGILHPPPAKYKVYV